MERRKKYQIIYILTVLCLLAFLIRANDSSAKDVKYSVSRKPDGGYTLNINIVKRHWKPITAEGFFPVERTSYVIDVMGKGRDWTYRAQSGFYYSSAEIKCRHQSWDFGYAWIDSERKYLYLNFYWVSSPDDIIPSDVNGKYRLSE